MRPDYNPDVMKRKSDECREQFLGPTKTDTATAPGGSAEARGWATLAKHIERAIDEARAMEKLCWKHGFAESEQSWKGVQRGLLALVKKVPTLARRVKVSPIEKVSH